MRLKLSSHPMATTRDAFRERRSMPCRWDRKWGPTGETDEAGPSGAPQAVTGSMEMPLALQKLWRFPKPCRRPAASRSNGSIYLPGEAAPVAAVGAKRPKNMSFRRWHDPGASAQAAVHVLASSGGDTPSDVQITPTIGSGGRSREGATRSKVSHGSSTENN